MLLLTITIVVADHHNCVGHVVVDHHSCVGHIVVDHHSCVGHIVVDHHNFVRCHKLSVCVRCGWHKTICFVVSRCLLMIGLMFWEFMLPRQ